MAAGAVEGWRLSGFGCWLSLWVPWIWIAPLS
jgi:hypothetical protein